MSKSQQAAINAVNKALEGTGIAPIALPSTNGSSKRRSKTTVKSPVVKPSAPFGFKADGTPRKRPVPTWLNNDKGGDKSTPKEKKTVAKKIAVKRNEREQDSVTITMVRGKRDFKSRKLDTGWMPSSNGGVRFEEQSDSGRSPHFMTQDDFAAIGSPSKIRVTVKALA
jgi:hypothetical protein